MDEKITGSLPKNVMILIIENLSNTQYVGRRE